MNDELFPEELARIKIDKQLSKVGWDVVAREDYIPKRTEAVKEALMVGSNECDYLLFIDDKAIAVVEAKREENELGPEVAEQAENYAAFPKGCYGFWLSSHTVPLVYLANGKKILFKNLLDPNSDYVEIKKMHSPKRMLKLIDRESEYGALPKVELKGLRKCQYDTEITFEDSLKLNKKKSLAILATGAGKTYLACLASYRLLNYTSVDRVLFLADRNNLAKQAENEFNAFDRTEDGMALSSLYSISRLRKEEDIKNVVVISTIQKLFAVMNGNKLIDDDDEDENDDFFKDECQEPPVVLGDHLTLPPDYFKFIVIDECHRSIYGKWKSVLDYFKDANVLGLTATPTAEAFAFFDGNIAGKYTYEESVADGVNVPVRIYDIETRRTAQGGELDAGSKITEVTKKTGKENIISVPRPVFYPKEELDRTVVDRGQIRAVLSAYRDSIYTDLYPDREALWEYIPKTLIFAKSDKHADEIVEAIKEVFKEKFKDGILPDGFVQKITYSAGDSNQLIRDFRVEKSFRIAVTVTLVSTGTDIRPLEVVMFMTDVKSDVLYTQMKGRGCRTINEDKLREVTPNANCKECFYVVDAVGVTKVDKAIPHVTKGDPNKLSLKDLLEHLSHGEIPDENLALLRDYCSSIASRYKGNLLFEQHLDEFIEKFGYSPVFIAEKINEGLQSGSLPPYISPSEDNSVRMSLISKLIYDNGAKDKLLELKKGYFVFAPDKPDELIDKGFSLETARKFIDNFEKYLFDHKDSVEALRIIYNSEKKLISYKMLKELRDMLLSENRQYTPYFIWKNYKRLDNDGSVDELDQKRNVNALTNLIQIARYAYHKDAKLFSLFGTYAQRFNLYVGSKNHKLTPDYIKVMNRIAEYIVEEGAINSTELNAIDADLWRAGVRGCGPTVFASEIKMLSKYIIGVA